jgi:hypothetical protein
MICDPVFPASADLICCKCAMLSPKLSGACVLVMTVPSLSSIVQ